MALKKRKKIDYGALNSPFMRIPRMDVRAARALLDLGFKEIYEIQGRDPETLLSDLKKIRISVDSDLIKYFKIATDFSEKI